MKVYKERGYKKNLKHLDNLQILQRNKRCQLVSLVKSHLANKAVKEQKDRK